MEQRTSPAKATGIMKRNPVLRNMSSASGPGSRKGQRSLSARRDLDEETLSPFLSWLVPARVLAWSCSLTSLP